jgi:hypothetical protein
MDPGDQANQSCQRPFKNGVVVIVQGLVWVILAGHPHPLPTPSLKSEVRAGANDKNKTQQEEERNTPWGKQQINKGRNKP